MNGEKKTLREIAVELLGDKEEVEIQSGLTIVKTVLGGAMAADGRDLDCLSPAEISAIVDRASHAEGGFYDPANSPIKGE
jgi:hypothetical protein